MPKTMLASAVYTPGNRRMGLLDQVRTRWWRFTISSNSKKRKLCLILVLAVMVVLTLIIGLSVGLTNRSKSQDLPLPSNQQTSTGDLTYYSPALGACGLTSSDNDNICAVSHILFDAAQKGSNPNANSLCGLKLRASRYDERVEGQRSVDLKVVDRCVGCKATDLDLSPGAFQKLADPTLGRVTGTWAWLTSPPSAS